LALPNQAPVFGNLVGLPEYMGLLILDRLLLLLWYHIPYDIGVLSPFNMGWVI
jgi:hypothetical protein